DPPDRLAGERRAVVAADDLGEPVFAEGPFQSSAHTIVVGSREALADQEITAEAVHDRQWIAVDPILGPKLPLEVDRPHGVRRGHRSLRLAGWPGRGRRRRGWTSPWRLKSSATVLPAGQCSSS